jgi:hypothetical protein
MKKKSKRRTTDRFTASEPLDRRWLRQMLPGGDEAARRADSVTAKPDKDEVKDFVKKFDELLDEQYDKDEQVEAAGPSGDAEDDRKYSDRWNNLPTSDK